VPAYHPDPFDKLGLLQSAVDIDPLRQDSYVVSIFIYPHPVQAYKYPVPHRGGS
jgi:hypothetical protein